MLLIDLIPELSIFPELADDIVTGISADSRKIETGNIFVAIKGSVYDGGKFIDNAVQKGAKIIIASEDIPYQNNSIHLLKTSNPRMVLSHLAARFYGSQPENIVAVTGTNGKTSVVNFTSQLWQKMGLQNANIGTIGIFKNGQMIESASNTTPDSVSFFVKLKELTEAGVTHLALEASSHGLDQYRIAGIKLKAAAFTNLSHDHLDYHGTMENYFAAKSKLFSEILADDGIAVLNADIEQFAPLVDICKARNIKIISYGRNKSDICLLSLEQANGKQIAEFDFFGKKHHQEFNLVGEFQIYNVMAALGLFIATTNNYGIINMLGELTSALGRMEKAAEHPLGGDIIIDYAHTPDALRKAMLALKTSYPHSRLLLVFGCGGERDREKRFEMGKIAFRYADEIIVTDDNPRSEDPKMIRRQIMLGCIGKAQEIADRREAIAYAISMMKKNDVLLIAGKGHEQTQIIGDLSYYFDDAKIARELVLPYPSIMNDAIKSEIS